MTISSKGTNRPKLWQQNVFHGTAVSLIAPLPCIKYSFGLETQHIKKGILLLITLDWFTLITTHSYAKHQRMYVNHYITLTNKMC